MKISVSNSLMFLAYIFLGSVVFAEGQVVAKAHQANKNVSKTAKKPKPVSTVQAQFREVLKKYSEAQLVEMNLKKEQKNTILEKTTTSTGKMYLGGASHLRMQIDAPEKSILVVDGKNVWILEPNIADGTKQKSKSRVTMAKMNSKHEPILGTLIDKADFSKKFKVLSESGGSLTTQTSFVILKPKDKSSEVKSLQVSWSKANLEIEKIEYEDELGNITVFNFSEIKFQKQMNSQLFQFQIPADAEVIKL